MLSKIQIFYIIFGIFIVSALFIFILKSKPKPKPSPSKCADPLKPCNNQCYDPKDKQCNCEKNLVKLSSTIEQNNCVICEKDDADNLCGGKCYSKTKKCINNEVCDLEKVTKDNKTCCSNSQNVCGNNCYDPTSETCMEDLTICNNNKLTSDKKICCGSDKEPCSTGCYDSNSQKCICP